MASRNLKYLSGFGNHFESEAESGTLPKGQNTPQKCPKGLYAEQVNGTAFTMARHENLKVWMYRIQPSVCHGPFRTIKHNGFKTAPKDQCVTPNQLRWDPFPYPKKNLNFIESIQTICSTGSAADRTGSAVHIYTATSNMQHEFFYNSDGDFLIVPQEGGLLIKTELGDMKIEPLEIAVIPRGIKFQVRLTVKKSRGYICENYGLPLVLPNRGPVGANGFANERDFLTPEAAYETRQGKFSLITKFCGDLWSIDIDHSPLNVVAWHGNYVPYKYDLTKFNTMNTVSFDHPDPSIFTVLTSPSGLPGTANMDFVIFPPRWMVAENTFRPPYYHRNVMSEYMGLIKGEYDAKKGGQGGFVPGGGSLHNLMTAHGPEKDAFDKGSKGKLEPEYYANTMAFMFESRTPYFPTPSALTTDQLQSDYYKCWEGLKANFKK